MPAFKDLSGQRFGRFVVIGRGPPLANSRFKWRCRCDCGAERFVHTGDLRMGKSTGCGCERLEKNTTHGHTKSGGRRSPEYSCYMAMRTRCENPKTAHFDRYGGRGIRVCEAWQSFAAFLADLGPRPSMKHTLERVNNDGNYEPGNVRWATRKEQAQNREVTAKQLAVNRARKRNAKGQYFPHI